MAPDGEAVQCRRWFLLDRSAVAQFSENRDRSACSNAIGSGIEHSAGVGQRTDAARCFYAATRTGYATQQGNIFRSSATGREACTGLEKVGSSRNSQFGRA